LQAGEAASPSPHPDDGKMAAQQRRGNHARVSAPHHDLVSIVGEAIEGSAGEERLAEEFGPLGEAAVGGKQHDHVRRQGFRLLLPLALCLGDGASKDMLRWVTHTPGDVFDGYTSPPWWALCEAVGRLRVRLPAPGGAEVITLPVPSSRGGGGEAP
jgi:hypothetical protein